jgi:hypothetical protein
MGVCIGCDFSSAKVADRGVADRRVVDERVADGCVADGRVFYKQDLKKKQRLAFGSLINLNRRNREAEIKIWRGGHRRQGKGGEKGSGAHSGFGGGWNHRREARRWWFD